MEGLEQDMDILDNFDSTDCADAVGLAGMDARDES
jgi:hypothetical protein